MSKLTSDRTLMAVAAKSIDSFDDLQKYFGMRNATRAMRGRVRAAFLDKAKRTPKKARRWFRIDEIEPDKAARAVRVEQWRASIWHRDLMRRDKSQVLCLSPSPLSGSRLPPDLARGEHFNLIVDDLWMSVPRWLQWFSQVEIEPPKWLASLAKPVSTMVTEQASWVDLPEAVRIVVRLSCDGPKLASIMTRRGWDHYNHPRSVELRLGPEWVTSFPRAQAACKEAESVLRTVLKAGRVSGTGAYIATAALHAPVDIKAIAEDHWRRTSVDFWKNELRITAGPFPIIRDVLVCAEDVHRECLKELEGRAPNGEQAAVDAPGASFEDATLSLPTSRRWIVKRGLTLTVGENGVFEIIKELWPNGISCKAADRDKQIKKRFETSKFTTCGPSTIKRLLQKVCLSDPK
jgi:hypothetical protein